MSTAIFDYTGTQQTWQVPAGVTSIQVDVMGAQGGSASAGGGLGGRVQATLAVTPGSTLYIYIGGQGAWSGYTGVGGWNGGGDSGTSVGYLNRCSGGGGASDIRIGGIDLGSRVAVAGGGGGDLWGIFHGGDSGYPSGTAGGYSINISDAGAGGSQAAGGAGGIGTSGNGTAGSLGTGGVGGQNGSYGGGGGGGGLYGGGGGGGANSSGGDEGAGGGGSSWTSGSSVTYTTGYKTGDGQIIITYTVPPTNRINIMIF